MKIKSINETMSENGISILIYASPGVGKTWSLQYLPGKTLIIDVDKGTKCLNHAPNKDNLSVVQLDDDLSNLKSLLEELENTPKIEFNNIALDSLTELEKNMLTILGRTAKNGGAPIQLHYNQVHYKISDLCRRLRNLTQRNINVIFTSWEGLGEIYFDSGDKISITKPLLTGKTPETIGGLCDIIARLEVDTKDQKTRYFSMKGTNGCYARDRIYHRESCKVEELIIDKNKNEGK